MNECLKIPIFPIFFFSWCRSLFLLLISLAGFQLKWRYSGISRPHKSHCKQGTESEFELEKTACSIMMRFWGGPKVRTGQDFANHEMKGQELEVLRLWSSNAVSCSRLWQQKGDLGVFVSKFLSLLLLSLTFISQTVTPTLIFITTARVISYCVELQLKSSFALSCYQNTDDIQAL